MTQYGLYEFETLRLANDVLERDNNNLRGDLALAADSIAKFQDRINDWEVWYDSMPNDDTNIKRWLDEAPR